MAAPRARSLLFSSNKFSAILHHHHHHHLLLLSFRANTRSITNSPHLSQEPQLHHQESSFDPTPLPPNPASGSPLYQDPTWRTAGFHPSPHSSSSTSSLLPLGLLDASATSRSIQTYSSMLDLPSLLKVFGEWMPSQRWSDLKQLFEFWIRSLDKGGKPNHPDISLYNYYLRANLMLGATAGELLDLVTRMQEYELKPDTASYNLVLEAMRNMGESEAAEKLLDRMHHMGKNSLPDHQSYEIVINLLFQQNNIDSALKYLDMTLRSGYAVSRNIFTSSLRGCLNARKFDALTSVIEKCKTDQNKTLCPTWGLSNHIVEVALQNDNSKLALYGLEFLAKWMVLGESARPSVLLPVDEGLIVSALGTAARTYNSNLLDASWAILRKSVHHKRRTPKLESYLGKICAYASLGNLEQAFTTLKELESAYSDSTDVEEDMLSPFTSLYPLVLACSNNGFGTLDSVYFQLENLTRKDPPYKSVAALNCIILGCANIWDLDRAYQTFDAISNTFILTPDVHSYNSLMSAFGKFRKTFEASRVFEHMKSMSVKPNETSYTLLVDAHLVNRDPKTALAVIDDMIEAGFAPSRETLKKVRRRAIREFDDESDEKARSFFQKFKYRIGSEVRREMLFSLEYTTEYS